MRYFRISLLTLCVAYAATASATDWLQFGYDQAHSGNNIAEKGFAVASQPGAQWNVTLHAFGNATGLTSDSAPIYLGNVATDSGTKDLLFLVTKNGTLVALSAADGSVVWSQRATPASGSTLTTGAPAIDPSLQYVYAYGLDGNVHKYQVGNGTEITGSGWPEIATLKPDAEKGAAGLAIASPPGGTNYLYSVTDGYIGDGGDYQGHITAINLSSGSQNVFNSNCSDQTIHFSSDTDCADVQNGIWGRPGAVYDAGTNRVFISTGNGPYNASTGGHDWGDSVLALNANGTGSGSGMPVDSYTPTTFQNLQDQDADLGSVSLAVVPAPPGTAVAYQHIGVQPGKDGCVRLINLADMSGHGAPAHTGGEIQAVDFPGSSNCATGDVGNVITPQPAVWVNPVDSTSWVFVINGSGMAGYQVVLDGTNKPSLNQVWTNSDSGTSPVVANNILYYASSGNVSALSPATGTTIWSNASIGSIHWQSLIVVNSHIYVTDQSSKLWSFPLDGIFRNSFQ